MRRKKFLVLDVETANTTDDPFVYDIGGAVCDKYGNIYEEFSFIVSDIFDNEPELMKTAYYAEKLPVYYDGLSKGLFHKATFYNVREYIKQVIGRHKIFEICAYNAHFDTLATNKTQRWLTKSKYRYFLPYGLQVDCIWHMACQVICTQKAYRNFCIKYNFIKGSGRLMTDAETVYRYMLFDQPEFAESHTGLDDVRIEVAILAHCFRQKKRMDKSINRLCWQIPQLKKTE